MKRRISIIKDTLSLIKFSKKVVVFCIAFITLYTIVAILFQSITGNELSSTLTERVFTCLIGELCITGMLKIAEGVFETFKKSDSEESEDDNSCNDFEDEDMSKICEETTGEIEYEDVFSNY